MDKVKLGRALGYGARHAAKTLAAVAEATTAPTPQQPAKQAAMPAANASVPRVPRQASPSPKPAAPLRKAGRSVWAPLATFSSALWFRVTGCFFALIALTMASGAWRTRGALRAGTGAGSQQHFWMFCGLGALFAYFAVSSFVRASRRERTGPAAGSR